MRKWNNRSGLAGWAAVVFGAAVMGQAAETPGPSTRRTGLTISEVFLGGVPGSGTEQLQWVEIYNSNPWPEPVGSYELGGDVRFRIPEGSEIPAAGYLVIASDPEALRDAYELPAGAAVVGGWQGVLGASEGVVLVQKSQGAILLRLRYQDRDPWPAAAFGLGHSLVLARPSFGEGQAGAWESSQEPGGSPGGAEPAAGEEHLARGLRINELAFPASPGDGPAWVELFNASELSVPFLSLDLVWDGSTAAGLPSRDSLDPGARAIVELPAVFAGETARGGVLRLQERETERVLLAVRFPVPVAGRTWGYWPDGSEFSGWLDGPTPGAPNPGFAPARVVINEIHYHPVSDDEAETFVELHNPGAAPVDLANWEFVEGITFVFRPGALLPAGGYAVLAKDRDRLKTLFPHLPDGAVFGNFGGSLARGGERLVLMEPAGAGGVLTEADTVAYADGGRWGRWADGGGSSLELVDPRADNAHGPNWADSAGPSETEWTLVERTDVLYNGTGRADQLQMFLMGAGEALVDDVEVLNEAGENLLPNGSFDQGTAGWFFQGTQRLSEWRESGGTGDSGCLLVRAEDRGDIGANRIRAPLRSALITGRRATLRAKVRWLRGSPEILLRTKGNYLEVVGSLAAPARSGTPGAPNSRAAGNAGPAILDVRHEPLLPRAAENVRVTALVSDPDGLGEMRLRYRMDPSGLPLRATMRDDGTGGDAVPGDGVFTGTIPGQASGVLVAFQVEAADAADPAAESRFPAGDGRECLVRFGEAAYGGEFTHYRLWMTVRDRDRWRDREKMSNEPVAVTFIDDRSGRAIYEAGSWYSGSAYSSPAYTSPDGILCGYDVAFPADEPFLGDTGLTLDFPVRDPTAQREQLMFWFCDQLGLPNNYRRYVHLFVNGVGNRSRSGFGAGANAIYEDVQQPGRDMIEEWFPGGEDGTLIKGDYWHEFDDGGARIDPAVAPALAIYTRPDGSWNTERYRWVWRPRARRGRPDDFSDLFRLATVVNLEGAAYDAAVPAVVDLDNWMRTFAANDLAANWDSFGNPGAKNTFHYLPPGGRWQQMSWDFDVGIGVFNNPVQASLFNGSDPAINGLQRRPAWERTYWSALAEAVGSFFQPESVRPLLQVKYDALRAAGAPVVSPFVPSGQEGLSIPGWIEGRRAFLLEEMAGRGLDTRFSITTNFGLNFSSERNLVRLAGKAPLSAQGILVNGRPYPVSWSATDTWNIEAALAAGANRLEVMGADAQNRPIEGLSDSITVTVTGPVDAPDGKLVFNEIHYHPADDDNEFLEIFNRSETTAFDLDGWRVGGVDFTFVEPALLAPGGYLLLVRDRGLFGEEHGWEIPVAGVFGGRLDNAGESLRLVMIDPLTEDEVVIDEVAYDDAAPWPEAADGGGPSLQLRGGAVDTGAASSWAVASGDKPYSPGAENTVPPMPGPGPLDLDLTVERTSGASAFVSFRAPAGFRWRVESSESLENSGPWPVVGEEIAGQGVRATVEDAAAAGVPRRFYRVRVQEE